MVLKENIQSMVKFDPEKLVKVGNAYNIETSIHAKVIENSPEGSYKQSTDVKNANNIPNYYEISSNRKAEVTNSSSQIHNKDLRALEGAFRAFSR